MQKNLKRKNQQIFRLDDSEIKLVEEKMTAAKIRNKAAYYRKMVLDGYIVRVDFSPIQEMNKLLRNAANNLNQIAKRINADDGNFFANDIALLQENYENMRTQFEIIFEKFAKLDL